MCWVGRGRGGECHREHKPVSTDPIEKEIQRGAELFFLYDPLRRGIPIYAMNECQDAEGWTALQLWKHRATVKIKSDPKPIEVLGNAPVDISGCRIRPLALAS